MMVRNSSLLLPESLCSLSKNVHDAGIYYYKIYNVHKYSFLGLGLFF